MKATVISNILSFGQIMTTCKTWNFYKVKKRSYKNYIIIVACLSYEVTITYHDGHISFY